MAQQKNSEAIFLLCDALGDGFSDGAVALRVCFINNTTATPL